MAEIGRRLVHASGAGAPAIYLLDLVTWEELGWLLAFGCVVALVLEALRLRGGLEWWIYDRLTREYEQDNLAGYALYVIGMAVVALAFPPAVGVPAMLMLAIGDPISGLLSAGGLGRKEWHVLAAMFAVCFAFAYPFVTLAAAVVGALAATVADGITPVIAGYVIDDNLTIPIGAAAAMWIVLAV